MAPPSKLVELPENVLLVRVSVPPLVMALLLAPLKSAMVRLFTATTASPPTSNACTWLMLFPLRVMLCPAPVIVSVSVIFGSVELSVVVPLTLKLIVSLKPSAFAAAMASRSVAQVKVGAVPEHAAAEASSLAVVTV